MLQVGLMVATLQLDASLLIQAFDLGFCDAFMPAEVFEECETAAKHAAAEKVRGCHAGHSSNIAANCAPVVSCQHSAPTRMLLACTVQLGLLNGTHVPGM